MKTTGGRDGPGLLLGSTRSLLPHSGPAMVLALAVSPPSSPPHPTAVDEREGDSVRPQPQPPSFPYRTHSHTTGALVTLAGAHGSARSTPAAYASPAKGGPGNLALPLYPGGDSPWRVTLDTPTPRPSRRPPTPAVSAPDLDQTDGPYRPPRRTRQFPSPRTRWDH